MKTSVSWPIFAHTSEIFRGINGGHGDVRGGERSGMMGGGKKEWGTFPLLMAAAGPGSRTSIKKVQDFFDPRASWVITIWILIEAACLGGLIFY